MRVQVRLALHVGGQERRVGMHHGVGVGVGVAEPGARAQREKSAVMVSMGVAVEQSVLRRGCLYAQDRYGAS